MSTIDPGLKFLRRAQEFVAKLSELGDAATFGLDKSRVEPTVKVLVQFTGDIGVLSARGFTVRTLAGDVASGTMALDEVDTLAALPEVVRMEIARPMHTELDQSLGEIRANQVHTGPPGHRGSGVIIGIIDSGIDIMHPCFRRQDGSTRILSIWDQTLAPNGSDTSPAGYHYGVEYSAADIDDAIAAGGPPNQMRHKDGDTGAGHGTHVAGIAAGDGSMASPERSAFTFVGVAPEADIIVVRNDAYVGGSVGMGDSANTLDAVQYIFDRATTLDRPVVINMSQGDSVGPHDGTSLLERGIDNLLGEPGRVIIKSAGNEGARARHASGTVRAGANESIAINMPANNLWQDIIDIWYHGADRFAISFTTPDGTTSTAVTPGNTTTLTLTNNNRVFVDSTVNNPNNEDNRIFVRIDRGTASSIQPGGWTLNLTGQSVQSGRFDAWIDRNIRPVPTFVSHVDDRQTISIPGTARHIITVGSYITSGAGVGSLSSFSSRGPTRDGRNAPTISAPGEWIASARASSIERGSGPYHLLAGTSMAAPHVAGAVALLLERDPTLTQEQVRERLVSHARADAFTRDVPNDDWGAGKLDVHAAFTGASPTAFEVHDDPAPRSVPAARPAARPARSPARSPARPPARRPASPWSETLARAHRRTLAQLLAEIQHCEARLEQLGEAAEASPLSDEEMQRLGALYLEHARLMREYQHMMQT